jgi:hypothetical protein
VHCDRGRCVRQPAAGDLFDHNSPIGTPTPDPRPYITVTATGDDAATVQYQWRQSQDPACCPTGIGSVRFRIEDGKLNALDQVPNLSHTNALLR